MNFHKLLCDLVMRYCCGYMSGARCRLFACGPADVTAFPKPLISCHISVQTGFTFLVLAYLGCPEKRPLNWCSSNLCLTGVCVVTTH